MDHPNTAQSDEQQLHCPSDSLLGCTFHLGGRLDVHAAPPSSDEPALEFKLRWDQFGGARRAVIQNSLPVFKELHQIAAEDRTVKEILTYSQAMRSILSMEMPRTQDGAAMSAVQVQAQEILEERALWTLTEILFLDPGCSAGSIAEALAAWYDQNHVLAPPGASVTGLARTFMEQHDVGSSPEVEAQYWPTINRLVALGRMDEAVQLMGLHSCWQQAFKYDDKHIAVQTACLRAAGLDLLRDMPRLNADLHEGGAGDAIDSEPEFNIQRQQWLAACNGALDDSHFWGQLSEASQGTAEGLRGMLEVMVGSHEALQEATVGWLELLVAELLHCYPTLHAATHLAPLMQHCQTRDQAGGEEPKCSQLLPFVDGLMHAGATNDVQGAMAVLSRCNSPWLMAHIPPVLQASASGGRDLGRQLPELGTNQVEECLVDYASSLMGIKATWLVAADILAFCPRQGRAVLEALLSNLPVEEEGDDAMANAALHLCRRHRLTASAFDICRRIAFQRWKQGRTAAALTWAGRAGDDEAAEAFIQPLVQAIQHQLTSSPPANQPSAGALSEQLGDLEPILAILDTSVPPLSLDRTGSSAHHDPFNGVLLQLSSHDSPPSNIACCREYHRLSSAMHAAGHTSFPHVATSQSGSLFSTSSNPNPAGQSAPAAKTSAASPSPHVTKAHMQKPSEALDGLGIARRALLRLVAQGAAPAGLRLPLLAAAIPLLQAQPPVLQHGELHALLSALEAAEEEQELFGQQNAYGSEWTAEQHKAKLTAVRLAFSRSLTCSFILQASAQ